MGRDCDRNDTERHFAHRRLGQTECHRWPDQRHREQWNEDAQDLGVDDAARSLQPQHAHVAPEVRRAEQQRPERHRRDWCSKRDRQRSNDEQCAVQRMRATIRRAVAFS